MIIGTSLKRRAARQVTNQTGLDGCRTHALRWGQRLAIPMPSMADRGVEGKGKPEVRVDVRTKMRYKPFASPSWRPVGKTMTRHCSSRHEPVVADTERDDYRR
jgi:hypothetical protein